MFRRAFVSLLLLVGVLVTPNLIGFGTPTVGAANPAFTPVDPARLLDTRPGGETIDGQAQRTGIQAGKTTFELQVTGRGGVPADALAVMLNVTAVTPTGLGFITVYPCGITRPLASNLNFTTTSIPNAVLAKIGTDGKVCVYTETATHILADVNAFVPKGASPTPVDPARLLDTRPGGETIDGQAQRSGTQTGKTTLELQVTGRGGVPADASAVMLNVTAVTPTGLGFITVYPCGIDRPNASNLNFVDTNIPNAVLAKIGTNGKVCIYTETSTHIAADVNAFIPKDASPISLDPARLLDTRPAGATIDSQAQRTGIQTAKTTFELQVTGRGGVPNDATAVMLNVTAVTPTGLGFITVYPCGINRPLASNLNFVTTTIPNAVLAKIGTNGKVCIYTETTTHIAADVNGYVSPTTDTAGPTTSSSKPPTVDSTTTTTSSSTTTSTSSTTTTTIAPTKLTCPFAKPTIPVSECVALVALYNSTGGPKWNRNSGWNTATDPCTWYGVLCTENNAHVYALHLALAGLEGPLPPEIGNLTNLGDIYLPFNGITALPPEIGKLTNLIKINLTRNKIDELPPEIGNLTNLGNLVLSQNGITALPPEIGGLTKLLNLNVRENQIASLPPEIGNLTSLAGLDLYKNQLTSLPPEIGKLTNLVGLTVGYNKLAGDITDAFEPLRPANNLRSLNLYGNGCLTTTNPDLGVWLTRLTPTWNAGC